MPSSPSDRLVYIAGPYSKGDPVANTRLAMEAGMDLFDRTGVAVIVPHLSLLGEAMIARGYDWWMQWDLALVERCSHMLRLPGESAGADMEVALARDLGVPIYGDLDALVDDLQ